MADLLDGLNVSFCFDPACLHAYGIHAVALRNASVLPHGEATDGPSSHPACASANTSRGSSDDGGDDNMTLRVEVRGIVP